MLLDFFGGIVLTAVMVVNVTAVVSTLSVSQFAKLALAAMVGLWIGLQVSLATAGAFAGELSRTLPLIGMMLAMPLVATAIAAAVSPKVRSAMLELPQPLLIGLNASRVLGVFFLLLAANGRLGGPFPQSAGWGDIITGVVALPLAFIAARRHAPDAVFWWNAFGLADLVAAVTLGTLSANGSVFQAIEAGAGSDAIGSLPWSLIPTVLVPLYIIMHGIIFAQLRRRALKLAENGA